MVVKILAAATTFQGVHYSERKNEQGQSALLLAENFPMQGFVTDFGRKDYIQYMESVCATNGRVKKRQFHAVLSAKAHDVNFAELTQLAKAFLDEMGYGRNPYLVYGHTDTANHHVHMVSTRVTPEGKKVDHAYERIRSQKVIASLLQTNPALAAAQAAEKALTYTVTQNGSIRQLLAQEGYQTRLTIAGEMEVIKYGLVQHVIGQEQLATCLTQADAPETQARLSGRLQQLRSLFARYRPLLNPDAFQRYLSAHHQLAILHHTSAYTVLDHAQRTVFAGSEVMQREELLAPLTTEAKRQAAHWHATRCQEAWVSEHRGRTLAETVSALGYRLDPQGALYLGEEAVGVQLTDEMHCVQQAVNVRISPTLDPQHSWPLLVVAYELKVQGGAPPQTGLPTATAADLRNTRFKLEEVAYAYDQGAALQELRLVVLQDPGGVHYVLDQEQGCLHAWQEVGNRFIAPEKHSMNPMRKAQAHAPGPPEGTPAVRSGFEGVTFRTLGSLYDVDDGEEQKRAGRLRKRRAH
ncbi:Relaxase/Mobilisation nuclease domain-containing protein [Catalinimonas alkaloidigena]|uniref:Relaxase/Mobilisation nuclease domain-containing protein n=1 Tax=Catalinimonas alkaloidigena TaxID=1075417 RepID=A0A1G9U2D3_9BACT|nr:relaxase/mobilization nuclease domain-containing protein [Catalinimonas alkaloidigena]SDM53983.1 Relaxase/Mobilisation nuclease domain-containing protein [Catalinimonas alkaloidigena]